MRYRKSSLYSVAERGVRKKEGGKRCQSWLGMTYGRSGRVEKEMPGRGPGITE